MRRIKMYSVNTYGGQIINDQQPRMVVVTFSDEEYKNAKRMGFTWDGGSNYYFTEQQAKNAIRWALSN